MMSSLLQQINKAARPHGGTETDTPPDRWDLIYEVAANPPNCTGNIDIKRVPQWVITKRDYPKRFSAAGESFLRKYDIEKLYSRKEKSRSFLIKDIVWCKDE